MLNNIPRPLSTAALISAFVTTVAGCGGGGGDTVRNADGTLPQYAAYVANNADQTISQYSISASGSLIPLRPATVSNGASPTSVTVDPTHHYVYVTDSSDNNVHQYVIQKDGTLAPNSPATVDAPSVSGSAGLQGLGFDPQGRFAYVLHIGNGITQFSVGTDGALEALAVPEVSTVTPGPWMIKFSSDDRFAYVADHGTDFPGLLPIPGDGVEQYAVAPDTGELSHLSPAYALAGYATSDVALDATNTYAYATSGDNAVYEYSVGSDGELTPLSPASVTGVFASGIVIHPNNKYAYATSASAVISTSNEPGSVSQFNLGTGGQLQPMATPTAPAGNGAASVTFDPLAQFVYVVNRSDDTVSEYSIGSDGSLTAIGTVATGHTPGQIATTSLSP
jgi:6-phosphogluconolactonase